MYNSCSPNYVVKVSVKLLLHSPKRLETEEALLCQSTYVDRSSRTSAYLKLTSGPQFLTRLIYILKVFRYNWKSSPTQIKKPALTNSIPLSSGFWRKVGVYFWLLDGERTFIIIVKSPLHSFLERVSPNLIYSWIELCRFVLQRISRRFARQRNVKI